MIYRLRIDSFSNSFNIREFIEDSDLYASINKKILKHKNILVLIFFNNIIEYAIISINYQQTINNLLSK